MPKRNNSLDLRVIYVLALVVFLGFLILWVPREDFSARDEKIDYLYFSNVSSEVTDIEINSTIVPALQKSPQAFRQLTTYVVLPPSIFSKGIPVNFSLYINGLSTSNYIGSLKCGSEVMPLIGSNRNICIFPIPNDLVTSESTKVSFSPALYQLNQRQKTFVGLLFLLTPSD